MTGKGGFARVRSATARPKTGRSSGGLTGPKADLQQVTQGGRSVRFFRVTTTVIARRIQADGTGSTSMDLLASRISMVDVSETHEIGFNLVRMKVLSASTSSTRMRRM
jgi:hypothetical protein